MGAAIQAASRERCGLHSRHPARFRLGGLRPLSMGAASRERYGLHSSHPDRFRLGGLRPPAWGPPSGRPVGGAGHSDTATQRRRDAHRPALKARGRPCSESRRRMRAQPWMAKRSRLRANGGHDGRSERPATGNGRPRSESFEPSTGRRSRRYAAIKGAKGIKGQSPKGTVSGRTAVVPVIPVQRRLAPTLHSNRSGRSRGRRRGR